MSARKAYWVVLILSAAVAAVDGCGTKQRAPDSPAQAAAISAKTSQAGTQAIQNDSRIPAQFKASLMAHYNGPAPVHAQ